MAVSSAAVGILESSAGVPDASSVYLVAVTGISIAFGVRGAVVSAVSSVLVYDLLFTQPQYTLTVSDPGEWLNLVVLLFVGVTVGQLAALQRFRAERAAASDRESRALFGVTRTLAARPSTAAVLAPIAEALARDAGLDLVWFAVGGSDAEERVVAQSRAGEVPASARAYAILHRGVDGAPDSWTLIRAPAHASDQPSTVRYVRVRLEYAGQAMGSIWGTRSRDHELPDRSATTLLRVAADLVAQALAHDKLAEESSRAEIARQSDRVKSALIESVSHDLRTPLASIRAFAGTLMDPDVALEGEEARASAGAIDREAQRLNRLVGNLLDLSRIEGGALRAAHDALDLEDVVVRAIGHVRQSAAGRPIEVRIPAGVAVTADAVLLEQVLVNLLDNAVRHSTQEASIRVSATSDATVVRLTVEDSGAGVPRSALPRIFDRFYRAGGSLPPAVSGMGMGLAVVRGFVEAMAGRTSARQSALGGLAIDVDLPTADIPAGPVRR